MAGTCEQCGGLIPPSARADAAYCSAACRQRAYRRRSRNTPPVTATPARRAKLARDLDRLAEAFARWRELMEYMECIEAQGTATGPGSELGWGITEADDELLDWLSEDFGMRRVPEVLRDAAHIIRSHETPDEEP